MDDQLNCVKKEKKVADLSNCVKKINGNPSSVIVFQKRD